MSTIDDLDMLEDIILDSENGNREILFAYIEEFEEEVFDILLEKELQIQDLKDKFDSIKYLNEPDPCSMNDGYIAGECSFYDQDGESRFDKNQ